MFTPQNCFKFSCKRVRRDHAFWLCNRKVSQLAQVQKKKSSALHLLFSFEKTSLLLPRVQLTADQSVAVWTPKRFSGAVPCSDALSYQTYIWKSPMLHSYHFTQTQKSQVKHHVSPSLLLPPSLSSVHMENRELTLYVTQTLVIHWQGGEQTFEKTEQHPCSTGVLF